MELTSNVIFILEMTNPIEYEYKETIRADGYDHFIELQHMIDCIGLVNKVPCTFNVARQINFITDGYRTLTADGQNIITDSFEFIVADKVPYIEDLQQYLLKNSGQGTKPCQEVHFKNFAQFNTSRPIFFTGPYEHNGSFLPDQPLEKRPLTARPLTNQDVVLDKELNQIWPVSTNKPPKELLELLVKTKEEIH